MKRNKKIATIIIISTAFLGLMAAGSMGRAKDVQQDIAKEIIRFHVRANSDTGEDQELKLKVKEVLVDYLKDSLEEAENIEEARKIVGEKLPQLEKLAAETMKEAGYYYESAASLSNQYFPLKIYGDMAFPAGNYEALVVELGKGEGKNWWCVMFPTLCFVDGTYSIVPEESREKLKTVLEEEEYEELLLRPDKKIKIKWKIAQLWDK